MGGTSDLTVTIRYYGTKAQDFYPNSSKGLKVLKEDLLTLKLPHPKSENVKITKGQCVFKWLNVSVNGVLHKHLVTKIWGRNNENAHIQRAALEELSMHVISPSKLAFSI
ncbi:hypothetical protein DXG03_006350 [Asterophora parasitica]|uniref:Uncharacterized protein n=1 Tax=Asterophora parasitica TaxID=117018 RepID=A0A9P7GDV7_9AGAR|nr:hypothetical protein DXG03_006350 [Asterophora parasitica]